VPALEQDGIGHRHVPSQNGKDNGSAQPLRLKHAAWLSSVWREVDRACFGLLL